jgi:hypothetical protein
MPRARFISTRGKPMPRRESQTKLATSNAFENCNRISQARTHSLTWTSRSHRLHDYLEYLGIILLFLAFLLGVLECVPPYSDIQPPTYATSRLTPMATSSRLTENCTMPPCAASITATDNIGIAEGVQTRHCLWSVGMAREAAVELEKWLHIAVLCIFGFIGFVRFCGWAEKRSDQMHSIKKRLAWLGFSRSTLCCSG